MKFKEFLDDLNKFAKENPGALELDVIKEIIPNSSYRFGFVDDKPKEIILQKTEVAGYAMHVSSLGEIDNKKPNAVLIS